MKILPNKPRRFLQFLLIAMMVLTPLMGLSGTAQAAEIPSINTNTPVLIVTSTATVTVLPDQARVSLAIVNSDKNLILTQNANNRTTADVINALVKLGIDQTCIQTSSFNVYPQYDYSENGSRSIVSYQVRNELSVVVKELAQLGAAVESAIKSGANNINSIQYEKSDPADAENQALGKAIKRAQDKARVMATASGTHLGQLLSLTEGYQAPVLYANSMYLAKEEKASAGAVPISPTDLTIQASVTLIYEML